MTLLPEVTGLAAELGFTALQTESGLATASMPVAQRHLAPIGRVHAATPIALADTACGYGCLASLPPGAAGFATSTITSHHLATADVGDILEVTARLIHAGRTTQLWDATITRTSDGRLVATLRCLQQILYPSPQETP